MRCMSQMRSKMILKTVLLLTVFLLLYFVSIQNSGNSNTDDLFIKDIFSITEADQYIGTEGAAALSFEPAMGNYIIDKGGRYILSGDLQGTLYIDAEDQLVHLILNTVSITGSNGPAISVLSAGKVFITSQENSINSLGDSAVYEQGRDETACIYSTTDLTFNGTGELLITGLFEDAVHCRDMLKILCSNLTVQSKRDCLRGNDGILIRGSNISLEAERNGIRTTNSGADTRGDVEIRSADLSVIAGNYCVNSASDFYVQQSECFFKGIFGTYKVVGEVLAETGCLPDA